MLLLFLLSIECRRPKSFERHVQGADSFASSANHLSIGSQSSLLYNIPDTNAINVITALSNMSLKKIFMVTRAPACCPHNACGHATFWNVMHTIYAAFQQRALAFCLL